jgi:hypothetical protein
MRFVVVAERGAHRHTRRSNEQTGVHLGGGVTAVEDVMGSCQR